MLLHLDGLTVKEISSSNLDQPQIKELVKTHNMQVAIDSDTLSDITENKADTTNIKFNCDTNN